MTPSYSTVITPSLFANIITTALPSSIKPTAFTQLALISSSTEPCVTPLADLIYDRPATTLTPSLDNIKTVSSSPTESPVEVDVTTSGRSLLLNNSSNVSTKSNLTYPAPVDNLVTEISILSSSLNVQHVDSGLNNLQIKNQLSAAVSADDSTFKNDNLFTGDGGEWRWPGKINGNSLSSPARSINFINENDDLCSGVTCGANAQCLARSFRAICQCQSGHEGDPYTNCTRSECLGIYNLIF